MNILITAVGSMSALEVVHSIRKNYPNYKIIGTDINEKSFLWITKELDTFYNLAKAKAANYVTDLIEICNVEKVDMIIPLTDPEVDTLCNNIERFKSEGIVLAVSNPREINKIRNKYNMSKFFENENIFNTIPNFDINKIATNDIEFPLIAKKIDGRSSEGLMYLECEQDVLVFKNKLSEYIIQPVINGKIITIDIINDISNNFFCVAREEKIRTPHGAGLSVEIVIDERIKKISEIIARKLNLVGCINFELIQKENTFYLMDINPRFSAGISFSRIAGYDFVYNTIRVFKGMQIQTNLKITKKNISKVYNDHVLN
jgi:carbamoyl-phosphate synthase large subunit